MIYLTPFGYEVLKDLTIGIFKKNDIFTITKLI